MSNQHGALCGKQVPSLPLILVVEADEANAEMFRLVLSQELPCLVTCVGTGKEALQMVEMITPDLLVLDSVLRDMSGLDLSDALRVLPGLSSVPVLLLSDVPRQDRGENSHLPCLEKPFDLETLLTLVRQLLGP